MVDKNKRFIIFLFWFLLIHNCHAALHLQEYRDFWHPTYHGERLGFCLLGEKHCGKYVASQYCKLLGYTKAVQAIIDYNVGLANFLGTNGRCKGWRCTGFKKIRCVASLKHTPPKPYHYRFRQFVYPRFDQKYRLAWCYDGYRGCGYRAAYSFCRRMGYLQPYRFRKQPQIAATRAIGNQRLCFGNECTAFKFISCYR